jgi:hypothetical protein
MAKRTLIGSLSWVPLVAISVVFLASLSELTPLRAWGISDLLLKVFAAVAGGLLGYGLYRRKEK